MKNRRLGEIPRARRKLTFVQFKFAEFARVLPADPLRSEPATLGAAMTISPPPTEKKDGPAAPRAAAAMTKMRPFENRWDIPLGKAVLRHDDVGSYYEYKCPACGGLVAKLAMPTPKEMQEPCGICRHMQSCTRTP